MVIDDQPKASLWLLIIVVLIVLSGAIFYFGKKNISNDGVALTERPNTRQPRTYTVYYQAGVFSPTNIRIHVGDTVHFRNNGSNSLLIIADDTNGVPAVAGFESGGIAPQDFFTFTFRQAGVFGYHNDIKAAERGSVTVRP